MFSIDKCRSKTPEKKAGSEYNVLNAKISAGSNHDPDEFPGLAHFTEHALFLGSRSYPEKSGIDSYVAKLFGGQPNAMTSENYTEYDFGWLAGQTTEELGELFDRVISMLTEPLIDDTAIRKEQI